MFQRKNEKSSREEQTKHPKRVWKQSSNPIPTKLWMGDFRGRAEARRRAGDKSEPREGFMHAVPTHHFFMLDDWRATSAATRAARWTEGDRLSA